MGTPCYNGGMKLLKRLYNAYKKAADKWLDRAKEWQPYGF